MQQPRHRSQRQIGESMRVRTFVVLQLCLATLALSASAQKTRLSNAPTQPKPVVVSPPPPPAAPIPTALLSGKTAFVSNAGADSGLFPHPFSGTPDRGYNQFYAAVQQWGRYTLVNDPGEADLVFELKLIAPNGPQSANKVTGASDPLPMFHLAIYDRKSHYTLWALTESIDPALSQKTHDHNLDEALTALTEDLKSLVVLQPGASATP
jgi:hypothetical protein